MSNAGFTLTDEVRQSMTDCGIGKAHHYLTMSERGKHGPAVRAWFDKERLTDSRGVTLKGTNFEAHDLLIGLARMFFLTGHSVRICSLTSFARIVKEDPAEPERRDVLCILRWQAPTQCPLSWYDRALVESEIDWRVDQGMRTMLWDAAPRSTDWWSPMLLKRLAAVNDTIGVGS